jgi:plasmid stabilization system protein ParE
MAVLWRERATLDLEEIHTFISADNPSAAARVVARLRVAIDTLISFPRRGRAGVFPGTLELVVSGLPYVIVYRLGANGIEIVTIVHGARRS